MARYCPQTRQQLEFTSVITALHCYYMYCTHLLALHQEPSFETNLMLCAIVSYTTYLIPKYYLRDDQHVEFLFCVTILWCTLAYCMHFIVIQEAPPFWVYVVLFITALRIHRLMSF